MDILESLKSLFTSKGNVDAASAVPEDSTGEGGEDGNGSIDPNSLRQVSYYSIRPSDKRFVQNYVPLVKVEDHELYIYIDGEVRVIKSQYFIPEHLEQADSGDIVFMFVHDQELFPLPRGRTYFDQNYDLEVRYRPTDQTPAALAAGDKAMQKATAALNKAKATFIQARDMVRNFATAQVNFVKNLPPLAPAGDTAIKVGQKAPRPAQPELIRILPSTGPEPRAGVLAVKKLSRSKRKEFTAAVDHLLRPD